jgi:hypothetical protein
MDALNAYLLKRSPFTSSSSSSSSIAAAAVVISREAVVP